MRLRGDRAQLRSWCPSDSQQAGDLRAWSPEDGVFTRRCMQAQLSNGSNLPLAANRAGARCPALDMPSHPSRICHLATQ
jgi:hypothetical protein